jgi:hypothetical protein
MAIIPENEYPAQIDSGDPDYPLGKAQDNLVFDDDLGTPLTKTWLNDLWGFLQHTLKMAGVEANGSPDKVGLSQYWDSLRAGILADVVLSNYTRLDYSFSVSAWSGDFRAVCQSPSLGRWVAVGTEARFFYSTDGLVWYLSSIPGAGDLYGVCWSESIGKFFCCGSLAKIFSSADGYAWTEEIADGAPVGEFYGIAASQNSNVVSVVGLAPLSVQAQYSAGGGSWTQADPLGTILPLYCVTRCDSLGKFFAGGDSGLMVSSLDGQTWTQETLGGGYVGDVLALAASESRSEVLAVGTGGGIQQTYGVGGLWNKRTPADGFAGTFTGAARADELGRWLIIGDPDAELEVSVDGQGWVAKTPNKSDSPMRCVAWGRSKMVIAGNGGQIRVGLKT